VVLGKCYPVIEKHTSPQSLEAKPITDGYNSHYVVTTEEGFVCDPGSCKEHVYDEIVLSQDLTALPVFLLHINKDKLNSTSKEVVDSHEDESVPNEPILL